MAGNRGIAFVAGAVLGALAGGMTAWTLGVGASPAPAPEASTRPAPLPVKAAAPVPHPAPAARQAVAVAPRTPTGDDAALRACRAALAAATGRAGKATEQRHATSGKLAVAKAIQAEDEGTPMKPPPGMPARFMDPKFARKAVKALFDTVGGGEVTSVDCTEFPQLRLRRLPQGLPQAPHQGAVDPHQLAHAADGACGHGGLRRTAAPLGPGAAGGFAGPAPEVSSGR